MTAVLIVSALPTIRAGLSALLASADDLEVVGGIATLDSSTADTLLREADVVLLDAASGDAAEEALILLGGDGPALVLLAPRVVLERAASAAPRAAWAGLPREATPEKILAAVRAVAAGLVVLDPITSEGVLGRGRRATTLDATDDPDDLTTREREVLELVALGLTNKAIAQRLGISDHTVKFHVASILAKLGAESRTEAVHLGARRGLLTL